MVMRLYLQGRNSKRIDDRWVVLEVEPGRGLTVEFTQHPELMGGIWGTFHREFWDLLESPEEWL